MYTDHSAHPPDVVTLKSQCLLQLVDSGELKPTIKEQLSLNRMIYSLRSTPCQLKDSA
jgi:hypothetical protein